MFDNRCAQPLVVAATLMAWTMLAGRLPPPALVTGYSVGEISAYAVAGVLPLDRAVAIASQRAAIMSEVASRGGEQGMAAVSGIAFHAALDLVTQAGCEAAIDTPGALIAGGLRAESRPTGGARTAGRRKLQALPINIASHTSLLAARSIRCAACWAPMRPHRCCPCWRA
jgi:[acyl-carrier-protein] S-malonyltransferase